MEGNTLGIRGLATKTELFQADSEKFVIFLIPDSFVLPPIAQDKIALSASLSSQPFCPSLGLMMVFRER